MLLLLVFPPIHWDLVGFPLFRANSFGSSTRKFFQSCFFRHTNVDDDDDDELLGNDLSCVVGGRVKVYNNRNRQHSEAKQPLGEMNDSRRLANNINKPRLCIPHQYYEMWKILSLSEMTKRESKYISFVCVCKSTSFRVCSYFPFAMCTVRKSRTKYTYPERHARVLAPHHPYHQSRPFSKSQTEQNAFIFT